MLRIVLDTNVLISGTIVAVGPSGKILHAFIQGKVEIITSPSLLEEYKDKLVLPRITQRQWMTPSEVIDVLALIEAASLKASGELNITGVTRDPKDDMILSAAVEMKADYIVSGDDDLKVLKEYNGIPIVSPAEFVKMV